LFAASANFLRVVSLGHNLLGMQITQQQPKVFFFSYHSTVTARN